MEAIKNKQKKLSAEIQKYLESEPEIKKNLELFNISVEQYEMAIKSSSEFNTFTTTKGTYCEQLA